MSLYETLEWLKTAIPKYTTADRTDDFNQFFSYAPNDSDAETLSFWEFIYQSDDMCNIVIRLKNMRTYEFNLSDVIRIHTKQRGEYIKLIVKTKKDCIKTELISYNNDTFDTTKEICKKNIAAIDFPIFTKSVTHTIKNAFIHVVSLCKGREVFSIEELNNGWGLKRGN